MEPAMSRGKSVLKWALTVGIVIVLNLFFSVAIETLMPQPKYEKYCPQEQVNPVYDNEKDCVAVGGQWNPSYPAPQKVTSATPAGYCDPQFTCRQHYSDASEAYAKNVFIALVILGALSLLAGVFVGRISPAVSAGLSYGGVLSFVIASARYWQAAGDLIRLGIVGLALVALIILGIKKFRE